MILASWHAVDPKGVLAGSQVNRVWREAALRTSEIWSNISLKVTHRNASGAVRWLQLLLERSLDEPLTIDLSSCIDCDGEAQVTDMDWRRLSFAEFVAINMLVDRSQRWKNITLHIDEQGMSSLSTIQPYTTPFLERFSLKGPC